MSGIEAELEINFGELNIDARTISADVCQGMSEYWARSFRAGRDPRGGAMPMNSKGRTLGQGSARIADGWTSSTPSGDKVTAESVSRPFQEGRYFYAVRSISRRVDIASTEGQAARELDEQVERATPTDI